MQLCMRVRAFDTLVEMCRPFRTVLWGPFYGEFGNGWILVSVGRFGLVQGAILPRARRPRVSANFEPSLLPKGSKGR